MGILKRLKAAVLIGCLLIQTQTFASTFYWADGFGGEHGDATSACKANAQGNMDTNPIYDLDHIGPVEVYQNSYSYAATCPMFIKQRDGQGTVIQSGTANASRGGTECAPNTGPFDPVTGSCPSTQEYAPGDKCDDQTGGTPSNPMIYDDTIGQCIQFTKSQGDAPCTFLKAVGDSNPNYTGTAYSVAGIVEGGQAVAPPTFAQDGLKCVMATISSSKCKVAIDGTSTCNVIGKFTGKGSSTGDLDVSDALCPNGTCVPQEPEVKTSEQPCVPTGTGGGGSSCTQTKETIEDGTQQCGSVNGSYTCITKKPYSNGISTNITSTSETLPDGSVKVTTVKDSSNTICTDVKNCTTKTSTTTSHTTTKPNGTTTTDSSCKGTCTSNGGGLETNTGSGTGNPATGDGNGGNGDGEGGDGSADTTDSCGAVPPCDGDPFLCAILKQDHIDTCKLMADATSEQKAAAQQKTDAAYASLDAHQAQMDAQVTGLLGQFQSATTGGASSGKCLPDKVIPMGRFGTVNIEFSKTCDSLSWVRLVLLAGAYLFAARIVFKEV